MLASKASVLRKDSVAECGLLSWQVVTPIERQSPIEMPNSSDKGRAVLGSSPDKDHYASTDSIAGRSLRSKRFFNTDGVAE